MILHTENLTVRNIAELKISGEVSMGGHRKYKIYGHLNCPNAAKWVAKGYYVKQRVLFTNESEAIENGYRPCGCCMKKEYQQWKSLQS